MAIWQFEIAFLPAGPDTLLRTNKGFDVAPLDDAAVARVRPILEQAFGPPRLEICDTASYGAPAGNRVDLVGALAGGRAVWACVDARSNADYFCKLLYVMAQALECELFSPEHGMRVAARRDALLQALMSSRAWVYAIDPILLRKAAQGWPSH